MSKSIKINQHSSVNQSTSVSDGSVSHSSSTSVKSDLGGGSDADVSVSVTTGAGTASFKGPGSRVSVETEDDGRPVILIDGEDEDVVFDEVDDGEGPAPDFEADDALVEDESAGLEDADAPGFDDVSVVESLDVDADGGHGMQAVSVMSALDLFLS